MSSAQRNPNNLLAVPGSGASATGNPRNKTALERGYSLTDWVKLSNSGKDLSGTKGNRVKVTESELSKHSTESDAWIALNGEVYNVTSYMKFHPGGVNELLKGVGKDATSLFNDVHQWINYRSMLAKCLVGPLVRNVSSRHPLFLRPPQGPSSPTVDLSETEDNHIINISGIKPSLGKEALIVDFPKDDQIRVSVLDREDKYTEALYSSEGKILSKVASVQMPTAGRAKVTLQKDGQSLTLIYSDRISRSTDALRRPWTLKSKKAVTHDVYEFEFARNTGLAHFDVPLGHHVYLKIGSDERMYTPASCKEDGSITFLIKIYEDGAFTTLLNKLNLGESIGMSNHMGTFSTPSSIKVLRLFAAGTGITPMCRIIDHFKTKRQTVQICLYFFNKTRKDIIWKDQISAWSEKNFQAVHIFSQESDAEPPHRSGKLSSELLDTLIGDNSNPSSEFICICGPIQFTKEAYRLLTDTFGYSKTNVHKFDG